MELFDGVLFSQLASSLYAFIRQHVFWAPILLFIEEAGVPLPLPGDVVVAYIGYRVTRHALSYPLAFIMLLSAVLSGSSFLYYLSSRWGQLIVKKLGKYIDLSENSLKDVEKKFKKYGIWLIIIGRHIPILRVPITFFAGMSGVNYLTFIGSTFISTVFWIMFYLYIGELLGPRVVRTLLGHFRYFPYIAIALLIILIIYLRQRHKNRLTSSQNRA